MVALFTVSNRNYVPKERGKGGKPGREAEQGAYMAKRLGRSALSNAHSRGLAEQGLIVGIHWGQWAEGQKKQGATVAQRW